MKTILFLSTLMFTGLVFGDTQNDAFIKNLTDLIAEVDGAYYYGDDAKECKATIYDVKMTVQQPVTNSLVNFKVVNDPQAQRHCFGGVWNCQMIYDLFDDAVVPNTLRCDQK